MTLSLVSPCRGPWIILSRQHKDARFEAACLLHHVVLAGFTDYNVAHTNTVTRMGITPGHAILLLFLYAQLATSMLSQKPLLDHHQGINEDKNYSSWQFNFTSAAPHYFHSFYGLLQQWPNTFFPNGHNIVPCEIPAFTRLYHGWMDADLPPSPEWLAFDMYGTTGPPEHCRD